MGSWYHFSHQSPPSLEVTMAAETSRPLSELSHPCSVLTTYELRILQPFKARRQRHTKVKQRAWGLRIAGSVLRPQLRTFLSAALSLVSPRSVLLQLRVHEPTLCVALYQALRAVERCMTQISQQLAHGSGSGSLGAGPLVGSAGQQCQDLLDVFCYRTSEDRGDPETVHWGHQTGK